MNFVFSVSSYPLSRLSARLDDTKRLVVGFLLLGAAEAAFAVPDSKAFVIVGIVFLGLHLGAVQGALVCACCSDERTGLARERFWASFSVSLERRHICGGYCLPVRFGTVWAQKCRLLRGPRWRSWLLSLHWVLGRVSRGCKPSKRRERGERFVESCCIFCNARFYRTKIGLCRALKYSFIGRVLVDLYGKISDIRILLMPCFSYE